MKLLILSLTLILANPIYANITITDICKASTDNIYKSKLINNDTEVGCNVVSVNEYVKIEGIDSYIVEVEMVVQLENTKVYHSSVYTNNMGDIKVLGLYLNYALKDVINQCC